MNLDPADRGLTRAQLDRKHTTAALRSKLLGGDRSDAGLNAMNKTGLLTTYMRALSELDTPNVPTASAVRVVRRVELDGRPCSDTGSHTIALQNYRRTDGTDCVRIYADVDDGEDGDKFHTTLADLKAAVAALESGN